MTQGHLLALKDAPILSADTLSVVAYWAKDVRMSTFGDRFAWTPKREKSGDKSPAKAAAPSFVEVFNALRVFARGPLQVWQMAEPVKADDLDRVFDNPLFRRAPGPFLNDPVRVRTACKTLLNTKTYRLSDAAFEEIEALADRLTLEATH